MRYCVYCSFLRCGTFKARWQNFEKRVLVSSCPLDGFSLNSIFEYFSKVCRDNSSFIKFLTRMTDALHEDLFIFMIISRSIFLRMGNIPDESCRENQNTYFMFSNFFPKIVPFMR
jgi:hypothetical protein